MIRVVLDTNIVVSAFFWGGLPREVLNAARNKHCEIVTSEVLIEELKDVISRPKFVQQLERIDETVETLIREGYQMLVEIVQPAKIEPVISDDPDDDAVIACALGGAADYIVSGDQHLLELGQYNGIRIVTVKQFLEDILENSNR